MQLGELKSLLSRFHIRPNKRLGQNFLLSEEVLDKIVAAADLTKEDTVLEIGPGLGFLTRRLAEKAGEVVAIEKDGKLCRVLRKVLKRYKNVKIICGDALSFDYSVIARSEATKQSHGQGIAARPSDARNDNIDSYHLNRYKLVANIPYYLTGKILQEFLQSDPNIRMHPNDANSGHSGEDSDHSGRFRNKFHPTLLVLLLQKEVAERIVAKPGKMSVLAVSVQFYADPEIIDYVGKENFYPKPEVDSAIVRVKVCDSPRFSLDERKFFQLVKIGFSNKRKQLQNNLKGVKGVKGEGGEMQNLLQSLGLNPLARAQDLSLDDWRKLYELLFDGKPQFML